MVAPCGFRRTPSIARLGAAGLLVLAGAAAAAPVSINDRAVVAENGGPVTIDVLANDAFDAEAMDDGELRISSPPNGTAVVDTRGTVDAGDDRIVYSPPENYSGTDVFSYQVCEGGGGCAESQLHLVIRPSVDRQFDSAGGAGFADIELERLRDLPDVMFRTTPLAWPLADTPTLAVDPTPLEPWDSTVGTAVVARTLPQPVDGLPKRWRVLVDARGESGDIDFYLGVDANGNSLPNSGEIACTAAMSEPRKRCELAIEHPGNGNVVWWVAYHNRANVPQAVDAQVFQVHLDENSDGTLVATGPGDVPPLIDFPVRVAWSEPTQVAGEARAGYVRVVSEGAETGVFPVRIDRQSDLAIPTMLGRSPALRALGGGATHDRLFIDVPEGATELRIVINAEVNMDLFVGPGSAAIEPEIGYAPEPAQAVASSQGPDGFETVVIGGDDLTPGRWFARIQNMTDTAALVTTQAFITAGAPPVRPGSYFNPDRSGHGVFLYPAADQWTGLWYTYFQDRTPTWYYLQGLQPGATGLWSSELYRAAWDGDSRELVDVGRVVLTPVGPDRFTWTYEIDGETGSETFQALGRGCPTLDGDLVDASSTWYDPDHAGTGYSVQYFPDYEYYAAFVYDALGVPRFITAERTSFGDADELIDLEQLRGFCPLCERPGDPERETIGVFGRSFDDEAMLETLAAAGLFVDGVDGTWSQDDDVVLLGGPGTTQGCDL